MPKIPKSVFAKYAINVISKVNQSSDKTLLIDLDGTLICGKS